MKIIKSKFFIYLFFITYFCPFYISGIADIPQRLLKIIIAIAVVLLYISYVNNASKDGLKLTIATIALEAVFIISTMLNGGDVAFTINQLGTKMVSIMLLSILIQEDAELIMTVMYRYFVINCFINTIMAIPTYGQAYNNVFWLGEDNGAVQYYILTVALSFVLFMVDVRKKTWFIFPFSNLLVFILVREIGTGLVVVIMMSIIVLFQHLLHGFNLRRTIISVYLINILYMFFAFGGYFINLINKVSFGKYEAFRVRTMVQLRILANLKDHILVGIGKLNDYEVPISNIEYWVNTGRTHNRFLYILNEGGVIAIVILTIIYLILIKNYEEKSESNRFYMLCLIFFVACFRELVEATDYVSFLYLPLLYYTYVFSKYTDKNIQRIVFKIRHNEHQNFQ